MKFIETTGDLFDKDSYTKEDNIVLAHCIAGDIGMMGGIALQFILHYDMKEKLIQLCNDNNYKYQLDDENASKYGLCTYTELLGTAVKVDNVYNLITKKYTYQKPTPANFASAIKDMKNQMVKNNEKFLAIPDMIGAGIDGLDRDYVIGVIKSVFLFTDITILAVKLK